MFFDDADITFAQLRISLNKMKQIFSAIQRVLLIIILTTISVSAQNSKPILKGKITSADGRPIADINVGLNNTSRSVSTDEHGNYLFRNLNEGNYVLKISGVGFTTQELSITINSPETIAKTIVLQQSSSNLKEVSVTGYLSKNKKNVILNKSGIVPLDLPQAVQVINTQVIKDQQANRLSDVLKNANGVALGANRGSVRENFYARGYSLGNNNILKNGARTSTGGSPEASTLESVEILKGSAAMLYGGVTGGAVVNMTTKKPKFEQGAELAMRVGSYDLYKPTLDVYGPLSEKVAYRFIATGETAASFRDHVASKRLYINPSILYNISKDTEILFLADYLNSDYTPDFGIGSVASQIVDLGRDKFLNTPWAYNKTNTASGQINLAHKLSTQWKLNVIASGEVYDRNYYGAERIRAAANGITARNLNRTNARETTYNQQANLTGELKTGSFSHKLMIGADADQSNTNSKAYNYIDQSGKKVTSFNYGDVNVFDPSTYYGSGFLPATFAIAETVTPVYRYGVFLQDLVSVTDQFKVLAGIRYTVQKNARTAKTTYQTDAKEYTATKTEDAFSPKLGLIYQPLKTMSFYVSYANNFISNTGTDIYLNALQPSNVNQYEAGVKNDFFGGRMTANLTYYKILNDNIAQIAEFDANGSLNSNATIKQLNGQSTSDGLEIDITADLTPGLNFIAGYAYNFMRYTNTAEKTGMIEDVRLVGTTKNTGNATLFYTVQNGKVRGLKFGASAYYTGDRNGGWNDNKSATTLRLIPLTAFTTIDLSAGYKWDKFGLLFKMSNITNELNYYVHENYSVNPIPPRQFATTLSYKF